jgi:hypothetical protein
VTYCHSHRPAREPPQRRLPPLLWVRLRRDLGEFLFESHNGAQIVYRWAHSQFRQAVEEEFLKLPAGE